jgi:threonine synthase
MRWLYHDDVDAMRHDIAGIRYIDDEVRRTIKHVYETRGYLLDPHSAIGYMGLKAHLGQVRQAGQVAQVGIFLATAHPAKFREIVEPVIGRGIQTPAPLAEALARPRHVLRMDASLEAVAEALRG